MNDDALQYWRATGYSSRDLDQFCAFMDDKRLVAKITFRPGNDAVLIISRKTWELQVGHFQSIQNFFYDVARHPLAKDLSGSFVLWLGDGMYSYESYTLRQIPLLSCGRSLFDCHSFLIPDPAFMGSRGHVNSLGEQQEFEKNLPFDTRKPTLFWRGAASGLGFTETGWRETPRGKLTLKAREMANAEILDAKFTKVEGWSPETIHSIHSEQIVGPYVDFSDFLKFKYLIDVDGICCAWISLYLKLASQSVTVKVQSEYQQWYYDRLKPWVHYVPLRSDLNDLTNIYEWLVMHPEECKRMIKNANALIASIRYEDEVINMVLLAKQILELRRD